MDDAEEAEEGEEDEVEGRDTIPKTCFACFSHPNIQTGSSERVY